VPNPFCTTFLKSCSGSTFSKGLKGFAQLFLKVVLAQPFPKVVNKIDLYFLIYIK
jgi:hypothetical protein